MEKQLPSLITIRIAAKGVETRVQVARAKFAAAWKLAQAAKAHGATVEALVAELYI